MQGIIALIGAVAVILAVVTLLGDKETNDGYRGTPEPVDPRKSRTPCPALFH